MKILFAFYRDWGHDVFATVAPVLAQQHLLDHVSNPEQLEQRAMEDWDAIVLMGWSWRVPTHIVNSRFVVGMHPSDLPDYAGGSPIQNQVLAGVEHTKATLFRLNEQFDHGEIIDKENIDLTGHLSDILNSISRATTQLILRFVARWPNVEMRSQGSGGRAVRRLKPEHSRLENPTGSMNKSLTCRELWDFIRCREDPYPNAFFEDHTGKLIIKLVEFEPK